MTLQRTMFSLLNHKNPRKINTAQNLVRVHVHHPVPGPLPVLVPLPDPDPLLVLILAPEHLRIPDPAHPLVQNRVPVPILVPAPLLNPALGPALPRVPVLVLNLILGPALSPTLILNLVQNQCLRNIQMIKMKQLARYLRNNKTTKTHSRMRKHSKKKM